MFDMQTSALRLLTVTAIAIPVAAAGCIGVASSGNNAGSALERTIVSGAGRDVEIPSEVN